MKAGKALMCTEEKVGFMIEMVSRLPLVRFYITLFLILMSFGLFNFELEDPKFSNNFAQKSAYPKKN